jgi:hypothetical protein
MNQPTQFALGRPVKARNDKAEEELRIGPQYER